MDINALRVAIRMLLNGMRPADLEKLYGFTHGFTARLVKKVREGSCTLFVGSELMQGTPGWHREVLERSSLCP